MKPIRKQYIELIQACWLYARDKRPMQVAIYVLFLCANICFMAQPYIIGKLINVLQAGGESIIHDVIFWLALYVAAMFAFWMFHGPGRVIERKLAFHLQRNFYIHFYDLIARLPIRWHQDHHSGNILHRVQKARTGLFEFAQRQFLFFETLVRALVVFIALAFLDWQVSLVLFDVTVIMLVLMSYFDRLLIARIHAVNEGEHVFSAGLFDFISNIYGSCLVKRFIAA